MASRVDVLAEHRTTDTFGPHSEVVTVMDEAIFRCTATLDAFAYNVMDAISVVAILSILLKTKDAFSQGGRIWNAADQFFSTTSFRFIRMLSVLHLQPMNHPPPNNTSDLILDIVSCPSPNKWWLTSAWLGHLDSFVTLQKDFPGRNVFMTG